MGRSTYLTDNFGRPSHYYETLPFGEMMVEHNQSASVPSGVGYSNKYKFNGKELDDATQMYYYGARYYDPRISIFVSVDPLAEQTMDPYGYVYNNPINLIDPTGMSADGWRKDRQSGEINYDQSYTAENTDDSKYEYGDAFYENGIAYNSDGSTSVGESYGDPVPCVECHHTTGQGAGTSRTPYKDDLTKNPSDIIKLMEGAVLYGQNGLSGNNHLDEHQRGKILFSLDFGDVGSKGSANASQGSKGRYEFFSGIFGREDAFKKGGELFNSDKMVKHNYQNYVVGQPTYSSRPFIAAPVPGGRDTFLLESRVRSTDWNKVSRLDSLKKAATANKLSKQYNLK